MDEILIIDPALRRLAGHHANAAIRIMAAARSAGIYQCPVLAGHDATDGLAVEKAFRSNAYFRLSGDEAEFDQLVEATESDLAANVRVVPGLIILPTCDEVLAESLTRLLTESGARPSILAWVVLPLDLNGCNERARYEAVRKGFNRLAAVSDLTLFCETPAMVDKMVNLTGLPFAIRGVPGETGDSKVHRNARPVVTMVGHMNEGKGYSLVPDAMNGIDADFVIHAAGADEDYIEKVGGIGSDLSPKEYADILDATDLLLLPYDPVIYRERGSGVCNEAIARGIPIVVTKGCSFGQPAIEAGSAVVMQSHSSADLRQAICAALADLPKLTECARKAAFSEDLVGLLQQNLRVEAWPVPLRYRAGPIAKKLVWNAQWKISRLWRG